MQSERWSYESENGVWYILCNERRVMQLLVGESEAPLLTDAVIKLIELGTETVETARRSIGAEWSVVSNAHRN